MPRCLFPQSATLDILERLLCWVLGHEKFCYHPLLLLKICPLLWATLLFMHCSCMLMEERSIHRLILQYFATVSNYKLCHVCNWCKSSATTPFYCLKFAPFCERHSFLCIVAVCWWKNEAYTDWYYSILLLSVIINSVTFVTDDFIFVKMERITKLLDKNVYSFILLRARYFT